MRFASGVRLLFRWVARRASPRAVVEKLDALFQALVPSQAVVPVPLLTSGARRRPCDTASWR